MFPGAHDAPASVEWILNGQGVRSPAGMTILEAARSHFRTLCSFGGIETTTRGCKLKAAALVNSTMLKRP